MQVRAISTRPTERKTMGIITSNLMSSDRLPVVNAESLQ